MYFSSNNANRYELYQKSVRCVDCHPQDENVFVAACYDG